MRLLFPTSSRKIPDCSAHLELYRSPLIKSPEPGGVRCQSLTNCGSQGGQAIQDGTSLSNYTSKREETEKSEKGAVLPQKEGRVLGKQNERSYRQK